MESDKELYQFAVGEVETDSGIYPCATYEDEIIKLTMSIETMLEMLTDDKFNPI